MSEKIIVLAGGAFRLNDHIIDHLGMTGPIDLSPPRIDLVLHRSELTIPEIRLPREAKAKDWEQRQRKRRRK